MIKNTLAAFFLVLVVSSAAFAELPVYPGAKPFGPAPQAQAAGVNVDVNMPNMPGMNNIKTASNSKNFTVPASTSFEEVKKFYAAELTKTGYAEKAAINISGIAMPTQTASFSSADGMKTVTVSLMNNPANPAEKLLSLSESSTAIQ